MENPRSEAQELLDEKFGEGVYRAVKRAEFSIEETGMGSKILRIEYGDGQKSGRYVTTAHPQAMLASALEDLAYAEVMEDYLKDKQAALRAEALKELYGDRSEGSLSLEEQRVFVKYLKLYREREQEK